MKSLFMLFLFGAIIVAAAVFVKGQSNSVNLYHICDKEVPWYDAVFLTKVTDKAACARYQ